MSDTSISIRHPRATNGLKLLSPVLDSGTNMNSSKY